MGVVAFVCVEEELAWWIKSKGWRKTTYLGITAIILLYIFTCEGGQLGWPFLVYSA